jgi:hypothetical protein
MSHTPEFVRQLSWTQASLDLCLDMERNQSDSRFAVASKTNEIVYALDESVFELFIGGHNEPDDNAGHDSVYTDRRRAVGIFNVREWRETENISPDEELNRMSLNRQSAILTTEWLVSTSLPGMKGGHIHISRAHLQELRARWGVLTAYYRSRIKSGDLMGAERDAVRALRDGRAALALRDEGTSTGAEIEDYINTRPPELQHDLQEFWASLLKRRPRDEGSRANSFWRYAFSRQLARELSGIRHIGPLAQLLRVNTSIAGRLRLLDHAGEIDSPPTIPRSEQRPFWRQRIDDEIKRRKTLGLEVDRSETTLWNDAATLAQVQSLANTAVRQNASKRYVFVTADRFIIDVYRAWHCQFALDFEPFVIRPVRSFAPLLNVASMSYPLDSADELTEKRNIFPALQAAINPFLLTLNLAPIKKDTADSETASHDDVGRWPREMFALRLRRILQEYRYSYNPEIKGNEEVLRAGIANLRFFTSAHLDRLKDVDDAMRALSQQGRQIERSAIGLGLPWLGTKLEGLKVLSDLIEALGDSDETALAAYIEDMVDEFGSANLDLQFRSLMIADDLRSVVKGDDFAGLAPQRVPLLLNLKFLEREREQSVQREALSMVNKASELRKDGAARGRPLRPFDRELQNSTLATEGGYRLFALFACVALRLGQWGAAQEYASEASYRVNKFSRNTADQEEVRYLQALCTRFQIGAGPVLESAGFDITQHRYEMARELLLKTMNDDGPPYGFVKMRASSELVSLNLFAAIWSARSAVVDGPKLKAELYKEALPGAWSLIRRLRQAIQGSELLEKAAERADVVELVEQVITNGFATCALANLLGPTAEEFEPILSDNDTLAWLDSEWFPWPSAHQPPPITTFYRYWYDRSRGRLNDGGREKHFPLNVNVDVEAQTLFLTRGQRAAMG